MCFVCIARFVTWLINEMLDAIPLLGRTSNDLIMELSLMSVVERIREMWWLLSGHVTAEPTTSRIILSTWATIYGENRVDIILMEPTPQLYLHSLPIWPGLASFVCPALDLDEACNILGDISKVSQGFPSWTPRRPWHWVWTSSCKNIKIESWDVWEEELRADLQWSDLGKYLCNLLANGEMSDCSPCGPDTAWAPDDLSMSDVLH